MATYTKEKDVETVLEDDIEARNTMQEVFSNTARWPAGFGGFTADVVANINGEEQKGTVTVKGPKDIAVSIEEEKVKSFLNENLASIAMHRGPRSFEESDGKYKLVFGDDGTHPLGRKVPRFSFTINIEESIKNQDGKFLTRKYSVFYFNPEKGLKDVESYTDEYKRVGEADLPEVRRIINCEEGTVTVSTMTLSNHKLL